MSQKIVVIVLVGAAIMGFEAMGIPFRPQQQERKVYQPDISLSKFYHSNFETFEQLYIKLKPLFNRSLK